MKKLILTVISIFCISCKDPEVTAKIEKMEEKIEELKDSISNLEREINAPVKENKKPELNKALKVLKEKELEAQVLAKKVDEDIAVYDGLMANFTNFKEQY